MQSLNIKDRTVLRLFAGPDYAYAFLLELRREPITNLKPVLATIRLHRNCHKINRLTPSKSKPKLFLLRHSDEVFPRPRCLEASRCIIMCYVCVCVLAEVYRTMDHQPAQLTWQRQSVTGLVGLLFIYIRASFRRVAEQRNIEKPRSLRDLVFDNYRAQQREATKQLKSSLRFILAS